MASDSLHSLFPSIFISQWNQKCLRKIEDPYVVGAFAVEAAKELLPMAIGIADVGTGEKPEFPEIRLEYLRKIIPNSAQADRKDSALEEPPGGYRIPWLIEEPGKISKTSQVANASVTSSNGIMRNNLDKSEAVYQKATRVILERPKKWLELLLLLVNCSIQDVVKTLNYWKIGHRFDVTVLLERQILICYMLEKYRLQICTEIDDIYNESLIDDQRDWLLEALEVPVESRKGLQNTARAMTVSFHIEIVSLSSLDQTEITSKGMHFALKSSTFNIRNYAQEMDQAGTPVPLWDELGSCMQETMDSLFALDEFGNVITPIALTGSKCHCTYKLRIDRIRGGKAMVDGWVLRYAELNQQLSGRIEQIVNPSTFVTGLSLGEFLRLLQCNSEAPLLEVLLGYDPTEEDAWIRHTSWPKCNYGAFDTRAHKIAKIQFQSCLGRFSHFCLLSDHIKGLQSCDFLLVKRILGASWGPRILISHLLNSASRLNLPNAIAQELKDINQYTVISSESIYRVVSLVHCQIFDASESELLPMLLKLTQYLRNLNTSKLSMLSHQLLFSCSRIVQSEHLNLTTIVDLKDIKLEKLISFFPDRSISNILPCNIPQDRVREVLEVLYFVALSINHASMRKVQHSHVQYSTNRNARSETMESSGLSSMLHLKYIAMSWCCRIAHLQRQYPCMRTSFIPRHSCLSINSYLNLQMVLNALNYLCSLFEPQENAPDWMFGKFNDYSMYTALESEYLLPCKVLKRVSLLSKLFYIIQPEHLKKSFQITQFTASASSKSKRIEKKPTLDFIEKRKSILIYVFVVVTTVSLICFIFYLFKFNGSDEVTQVNSMPNVPTSPTVPLQKQVILDYLNFDDHHEEDYFGFESKLKKYVCPRLCYKSAIVAHVPRQHNEAHPESNPKMENGKIMEPKEPIKRTYASPKSLKGELEPPKTLKKKKSIRSDQSPLVPGGNARDSHHNLIVHHIDTDSYITSWLFYTIFQIKETYWGVIYLFYHLLFRLFQN
jgi:hypothetical protein